MPSPVSVVLNQTFHSGATAIPVKEAKPEPEPAAGNDPSTDDALVSRLEAAASTVNAAARDAAVVEGLKDDHEGTKRDLKELATHVATIAAQGPGAASEAVSQKWREIDDRLSAVIARLDDLSETVEALRTPAPMDDLPPIPAGAARVGDGWLRSVLRNADDSERPRQTIITEPARQVLIDDQWSKALARYQIAVEAANGSLGAKQLLIEPAAARGLSCEDLAQIIIDEWRDLKARAFEGY